MGLTSTGYVERTAAEIADELAADLRASSAFGADVDTSGESVIGQLLGVFASQLASVEEAAGVVYRSRDPAGASFASLDAVCALTGTTRRAATKGTVTLTVNLNGGVTLPAGSIAHVSGSPANRWVTTAAAVNSGGIPANVTVNAEGETAGVYAANAATITVIATPVTGWNSVTNASDAAVGAAAESDPVLRARRERELAARASSLDALRGALMDVTGVSSAVVDENAADDRDALRDLPGHSVRCVVQGGVDADVASAIWAGKPAGIQTQGTTSVIVTDDGGFPRAVRFSRPTNVDAYATVRVAYDDAAYEGDATLAAALANVTTGQLAGAPIRTSALITAALAVPGVVDCTVALLGRSSGAQYGANLTAGPSDVLKLATGRITITRVYE